MDTSAHAQPSHTAARPAYAALDLGTNNCRLLIAAPTTSGFRVLDSFSRVVRLGEGLHESGQLSAGGMNRAMSALETCADRLARRPAIRIRAIATEACRRAANAPAFLSLVQRQTGLCFDVISPREEAELALESCAPLLQEGGRRALLFDIGGGSTELVWVRLGAGAGPVLTGTISMPIGVVSLAERYGATMFTANGFEAMVAEITARLGAFEKIHCIGQEIAQGGVSLLGTSGTVTTLAGIVLGLQCYHRPLVDGQVLTRVDAMAAVERLRAMGRAGLAAHPCVGPERTEFTLPGCAIFTAIQRKWPVPSLTVADRGLREGLLLRLMRDAAGRPA
jgi:exopolyphosphatase/guanosine-5'-triphosphate,3'-diphosphate pyrophosphatase